MVYKGKGKGAGNRGRRDEPKEKKSGQVHGSVKPALYINPAKPFLQVNPSKNANNSPNASLTMAAVALAPIGDGASNADVSTAMSEIYSRIRAVNAGAANYDPNYIYSYIYWVRDIRAFFIEAAKMVNSTKVKLMGYAEYPNAVFNVVGGTNYNEFSTEIADKYADLLKIAQDIDALPLIPFEAYARDSEMLNTIIREQHGGRCSYLSPVLTKGFIPQWNGTTWSINQASIPVDADRYSNIISHIKNWLGDLVRSYEFAILRGDILKAYGAVKVGPTMEEILSGGVQISSDAHHISTYHNGTCFQIGTTNVDIVNTSASTYPEFAAKITPLYMIPALNDNVDVWVSDLPSWDETELEYATRLVTGTISASGTSNYTVITRGFVWMTNIFLTGISPMSAPTLLISRELVKDGQTSTTQSTASAAMTKLSTFAMLMPNATPKTIINDEVPWLLWAVDNAWELPKWSLFIMLKQYVRNAYVSAPMVWSKNAQSMA